MLESRSSFNFNANHWHGQEARTSKYRLLSALVLMLHCEKTG
jgi:hypothetical protein